MGCDGVVVVTPLLDQDLGLLEAAEDFSVEQLVPHSSGPIFPPPGTQSIPICPVTSPLLSAVAASLSAPASASSSACPNSFPSQFLSIRLAQKEPVRSGRLGAN